MQYKNNISAILGRFACHTIYDSLQIHLHIYIYIYGYMKGSKAEDCEVTYMYACNFMINH